MKIDWMEQLMESAVKALTYVENQRDETRQPLKNLGRFSEALAAECADKEDHE